MKVIGGSFGISGSAHIRGGTHLIVDSGVKAEYQREAITSMHAKTEREKKFGALGFIVGAILLSIILGMLLSVVGVAIAIVVAAAGSFYSVKRHEVQIGFSDGNSVTLECSKGAVQKLIALRP